MPDVFPRSVAHKLKYYVYVYINPLDGEVFYVGKGRRNRAFTHLNAAGPSCKARLIAEIRKQRCEPRIEILVHGLEDEQTALKIEAAVIDLLGPDRLTNQVRGYHSRAEGRMNLDQIRAIYGATEVDITEPTILIRINRLYRHTMPPHALYEATRFAWKVGPNRDKAKLAMAVYAGVIREVYEIEKWFPAGSTFLARTLKKPPGPDRWEFVGRLAEGPIRKKYLYRSVAHYFPKASQNPIQYVNVK